MIHRTTSNANVERLSIDERIGRIVVERMSLKVTGTLGVLLKAKQQKLIPLIRGGL